MLWWLVFFLSKTCPHNRWSYCSRGKPELLFKQISQRRNLEYFPVHCTDVFIKSFISMFLSLSWSALSTRWLPSVIAGPVFGQGFIGLTDGDNQCFFSIKVSVSITRVRRKAGEETFWYSFSRQWSQQCVKQLFAHTWVADELSFALRMFMLLI